ncbi:TPA: RNA-binding protein [Elizabethkingia meningoseptica]|uniref:CvfB family protein n=1 Tax=Elizabethkingia meningoseptica TaxID=238 RepID=UPI0022F1B9A6|nr:S1-like domain-containing RNA-binding protein [Elizabethkingia meningoseptica]EJK5328882.1 RNA-binding protein [Elizabethkingia meningoseptica]MDE5431234.1 RNA-binding protein [Elizabethkingia meningoseptica]WBS75188.1 S1-like domain-containing RNA-binding protein [Elizabethkingia meningoseptica]HAY3562564.1 RNA-binding protein [Elizabethkingia meningoseptica]
MQIGKKQHLTVSGKSEAGFQLKDELGNEISLSRLFADPNTEVGDEIEVFIYQEEGSLRATTETPFCEVDEYAVLRAVQTLPSGAFMDWGIIKDLFVPYKQQKGKIVEDKRYLVYVYIDEATGLITGTTKFKRNPQYDNIDLKKGDKVSLILMNETELGWNVVINQKYIGLIYASDVYKKLYPLNVETGYIKAIREDGKIDVTLQPEGFENIDSFRQSVLDALDDHGGLLYLSDKSTPEEIKDKLQMSKKNFKRAIGGLYKDGVIEILEDKIRVK